MNLFKENSIYFIGSSSNPVPIILSTSETSEIRRNNYSTIAVYILINQRHILFSCRDEIHGTRYILIPIRNLKRSKKVAAAIFRLKICKKFLARKFRSRDFARIEQKSYRNRITVSSFRPASRVSRSEKAFLKNYASFLWRNRIQLTSLRRNAYSIVRNDIG